MGLLDKKDGNCIKKSSKCIIWFGGKVCSISVCDGDTIEDIVKKLGKSIYAVEKSLDINSLDFTSLLKEKQCSPEDLKGVIQLIINHISETTETFQSENVAILVTPASCFTTVLGNDPIDIRTYVEYIGETVCSQRQEIENLKDSLAQMRNTVTDLTEQIQTLIGG